MTMFRSSSSSLLNIHSSRDGRGRLREMAPAEWSEPRAELAHSLSDMCSSRLIMAAPRAPASSEPHWGYVYPGGTAAGSLAAEGPPDGSEAAGVAGPILSPGRASAGAIVPAPVTEHAAAPAGDAAHCAVAENAEAAAAVTDTRCAPAVPALLVGGDAAGPATTGRGTGALTVAKKTAVGEGPRMSAGAPAGAHGIEVTAVTAAETPTPAAVAGGVWGKRSGGATVAARVPGRSALGKTVAGGDDDGSGSAADGVGRAAASTMQGVASAGASARRTSDCEMMATAAVVVAAVAALVATVGLPDGAAVTAYEAMAVAAVSSGTREDTCE